ncbi:MULTISPECIES: helix-turn-helix transcriptional regulator [Sphingobacterium]|jgi:AraC-like DNA-binding protein|uniref:helix-turn-helix transcriptional regulator n=1 Tax=Sphingobacterium TaxID=28453 RepID=UPI000B48B292|nr:MULTISPECIES: helix-turn-helix domain-containing protein [Sphingobacterium]
MERSFYFALPQEYQAVDQPRQSVSHPIRNANERHWTTKFNSISELTFDGRYGYLYYYEFWMDQEENIPVYTSMGDLHLVYPLLSNSPLRQIHRSQEFVMDFVEGRGAYLYLSKGEYKLKIPKGHHIMVGFILDAGLFRPPANRHFSFLQDLIIAKKAQSKRSINSVTFRVGEITKRQLKLLFSRINPNILDNEHLILKHMIFLIQLSRFKLRDDGHEILIDRARNLLQLMILHQGAKVKLSDIAEVLLVTRHHLNDEHKKHYGCKFISYRHQVLLDHIATIIVGNDKLLATAEECGFSSTTEMNAFIKNQTGLTSLNFKQFQKTNLSND